MLSHRVLDDSFSARSPLPACERGENQTILNLLLASSIDALPDTAVNKCGAEETASMAFLEKTTRPCVAYEHTNLSQQNLSRSIATEEAMHSDLADAITFLTNMTMAKSTEHETNGLAQVEHFLGKALSDEIDSTGSPTAIAPSTPTKRTNSRLVYRPGDEIEEMNLMNRTQHVRAQLPQFPTSPAPAHSFMQKHAIACNGLPMSLSSSQQRFVLEPPMISQTRHSTSSRNSFSSMTDQYHAHSFPMPDLRQQDRVTDQYPSLSLPMPYLQQHNCLPRAMPSFGSISSYSLGSSPVLSPTGQFNSSPIKMMSTPSACHSPHAPTSPKCVMNMDSFHASLATAPPNYEAKLQTSNSGSQFLVGLETSSYGGRQHDCARPLCEPCVPSPKVEKATLVEQSPCVPDSVRSRLLDATKFRSVKCRSVDVGVRCSYYVCNFYHSLAEKQEPIDAIKIGVIAKELNKLYSNTSRSAARKRDTMDTVDYALMHQAIIASLGRARGQKWWDNSLFALDLNRRMEIKTNARRDYVLESLHRDA